MARGPSRCGRAPGFGGALACSIVPADPDNAMLQLVRALAREAAREGYRRAVAESRMDLRSGWRSIGTAPLDEEVELLVAARRGKPYRIPYPCKLTAASGWVSSRKGTPLAGTPLQGGRTILRGNDAPRLACPTSC
jgi:hypothetical protein